MSSKESFSREDDVAQDAQYASNDGSRSSSVNLGKSKKHSTPSFSNYILVSILCCLAAMGGFVFGYDTGTISGYTNMPEFQRHFGVRTSSGSYDFPKWRSSLIVSAVPLGAGIGGVFLSRIGDIFGRKGGILGSCIIYMVGVLIQITSVNAWYQFYIGRVIGGLGIGILSVLVPSFKVKVLQEKFVVL